MSTVDPSRSAVEPLGSRLEFETLLSDLSSRFINVSPGDVDREIEDALRRVCELLGLDVAVLWQWSASTPDLILPTHAYPRRDDPRQFEPLHQEAYPWVVRQVRAGQTVAVSSMEELPPEAAVDRDSARQTGIRSNLTLPLTVGGEPPVGALAFNALRAVRGWPEALVQRLSLVAQVFANALARRRAEQVLRTNETRLASGADLAGLAFYEVDLARGVMYADDRTRDLCGVPSDRVDGLGVLQFWLEHLHPDDAERVKAERDRLHDGRIPRLSIAYRYLNPVRGELWVHHLAGAAERDGRGRATRTYAVLRDVTEQKRAEASLKDLSRRLIRAQEEERALLARELHDDLSQRLAVLAIDAGRAELASPAGPHAESLRAVREGLGRLSEAVHALAYQLHPSVLEELGLAEALRTECERRARQARVGISVSVDAPPDTVGREAALCLFRVAQEALTNVIRHAEARTASVELRRMDGGLLLAVRDDGAGFDPAAPRTGRSLGLASMRERVQLASGTLDVESSPGHGTLVVAWVPGLERTS